MKMFPCSRPPAVDLYLIHTQVQGKVHIPAKLQTDHNNIVAT